MVSQAQDIASPQELRFADSADTIQGVGFFGRMKDKLRRNVPRLVGGGKFTADGMLGFGGSPVMMTVSALYFMARTTLMAFGGTAEPGEEPKEKSKLRKAFDSVIPKYVRNHPVETASVLGTAAAVGFIVEGVVNKQPLSIATGLAAGLGETIIWAVPYLRTQFDLDGDDGQGKDAGGTNASAGAQQDDAAGLTFAHSTDEVQGFFGKAKDWCMDMVNQPVRLGSALLALSSVSVLANGIATRNPAQVVAGLLYIGANIAQGIFVDKNLTGEEVTLPDEKQAERTIPKLASKFTEKTGELKLRDTVSTPAPALATAGPGKGP